ncbi:MAG: HD domain-containing phosphohydrolase [Candidatus Palauibacterales bacterium]|nr:HD domain-containing phosphohydrolase [Candidatus Palauibacterales bacterium]MDP2528423.1 HD domain-containing phosphohydrolase [Candidatus Palauibacterales bacterium]MDP2583711.1 HD domain-containing phosphohydrolase [Candidatus Palauibacterales bacterium]
MSKHRRVWSYPWILALAYLVLGALWILVSDRVVAGLAGSQAELQAWQLWKGWVFVGATALVLFLLARAFLRSSYATRTTLARIMDLLPDPAVVRKVDDDTYLVANRAFQRVLGRERGGVEGRDPDELGIQFDPADWAEYGRHLEAEGEVRDFPLHVILPDGTPRTWLTSSARDEFQGTGVIVATTKDVTDLEAARLHAENQVRRIKSLREIDLAITASRDLPVTLDLVLQQVVEHLAADAAAILMWSDVSQKFEFAAARGFRTRALRHTALALGEGYAGQVARDRRTRVVQDLATEPGSLARSPELEDEDFASYAATPLVAKGRVNGVLEVFRRSPLPGSREWRDFLEVLAGQAAIAIDSAHLFQDLQDSHRRLRAAYGHTIEGWARALTLRDAETWDHTERVTEITLRLARRMGVPEEALTHVRHGALLHDIGKVGVPDAILLKPGPLDEDEWRVMRRHPVLAYQLLAPIDYLQPALAIPYAHHEKWDGTGYPRGLSGREIPFTARIFAVVDVWDALRSDRPYRDAWSPEKALEHIRAQSGRQFDPEVTSAFLALHEEEGLEAMRGTDHGSGPSVPVGGNTPSGLA